MIAAVLVIGSIASAPALSVGVSDVEGCTAAPSPKFAQTVKRVYDPLRWHRAPKRSTRRTLARGADCRGQQAVHRKARTRWRKARTARICGTPACNVRLGVSIARAQGYGRGQRGCLVTLGYLESGWDETARNSSSGAGGIPQALPPSKMGHRAQGSGWRAAYAQVKWMLDYIRDRYGTPCGAVAWHTSHNWY